MLSAAYGMEGSRGKEIRFQPDWRGRSMFGIGVLLGVEVGVAVSVAVGVGVLVGVAVPVGV